MEAYWLKSAFERLGDRKSRPTQTAGDLTGLRRCLYRCGEEFSRIVLELDLEVDWKVELREDLATLREKDFPPLDLAELLVRCTGAGIILDPCVWLVGLPESDLLKKVRTSVESVCDLHPWPFLVSPLLADPQPPASTREDFEAFDRGLPSVRRALDYYFQLNMPADEDEETKYIYLAFLYLLTNECGLGFPTVSRLLKTMRRVWQTVLSDAEYLQRIRPTVMKRLPTVTTSKAAERDPLSGFALEKRWLRFFSDKPEKKEELQNIVQRYLSGEFREEQSGCETLPHVYRKIRQSASSAA